MKMKENHSKMSNINYDDRLKVQSYLKSDSNLTNDEKQLLFKLRTRMAEFRNHFRNKYENIQCKLCISEIDQQQHMFYCQILIENCKVLAENVKVEYEDIFSTNQNNTKQNLESERKLTRIRLKFY